MDAPGAIALAARLVPSYDQAPGMHRMGEQVRLNSGHSRGNGRLPGSLRPVQLLSPLGNLACITELLRRLVPMRDLLAEIVSREINAPHAGHGLGRAWAYIHPLVIVGVYLLVLGFVIGGKITANSAQTLDYPSYILAGLVPWLMMQNALLRATSALTSNANLIKQVVFPIEVLPVAAVASATIP
ncbi:MAG: hypothetical protein C5B46_00605, partial [Proteobacteria bacterium]